MGVSPRSTVAGMDHRLDGGAIIGRASAGAGTQVRPGSTSRSAKVSSVSTRALEKVQGARCCARWSSASSQAPRGTGSTGCLWPPLHLSTSPRRAAGEKLVMDGIERIQKEPVLSPNPTSQLHLGPHRVSIAGRRTRRLSINLDASCARLLTRAKIKPLLTLCAEIPERIPQATSVLGTENRARHTELPPTTPPSDLPARPWPSHKR